MISAIFHTVVYDPLYNALIFFVDVIPTHDVGIAVIALTILVRVILIPLSRRASETQSAMRKIAPEVEEIKEKYKNSREEQSKAIFALYKERGVHPFAGIGLLFLQLPVLISLYWIFAQGGLPEIKPELLYAFIPISPEVSMEFLGLIDMAGHSLILGLLAAGTQFFYTRLSMGKREPVKPTGTPSFSGELARSFDLQARYVLPATFVVLSYFIPNAAMLYLITSNTFMVVQEFAMGRRL